MPASTILVCTNSIGLLEVQLRTALQIAARLGSEITMLTFRTAAWPAAPERGFFQAEQEAAKAAWSKDNDHVASAKRTYDAIMGAYKANATDSILPVRWVEASGTVSADFPPYSRACDIIITGGSSEDLSNATLDDAVSKFALLDSGRLALFVTTRSKEGTDPFAKILIAWNDQPAAARAIAQAMPLIAAAAMIRLFIVEPSPEHSTPCNQILAYLRQRAPTVDVKATTVTFGTVGQAIITEAEEWGATLIIMGAYGHSRAQELLFGGATLHVVKHAGCLVAMTH